MYYILGFQFFQLLIFIVGTPLLIRYLMKKWEAEALSRFEETLKNQNLHFTGVESRVNALEVRVAALNMNLERRLTSLSGTLEKMPTTVLRTLQGSVNSTSGKLGELVQFIELQRAYDRLIPVGNIVDFVAVKFPTADSPGVVHFIDVKTGKRAVLSKDQKRLKGIIDSKLVEFHTVKMEVT